MIESYTTPPSDASGNTAPLAYEHARRPLPADLKRQLLGLRQYALRHPEHSAQWVGALSLLIEREARAHG